MLPTTGQSRSFTTLSRRRAMLGAAGLAGAALLAGCSGRGAGATVSSSTGTSGQPAGFPVTVAGKEGSVSLDAAPARVVAVGYLRDTDLALALGANLVGLVKNTSFPSGIAPWQKLTDHPTVMDASSGLPLEKIAALRPDLILASDDYTLSKDYPNLSRIAPTLSYQAGVGQDDWQSMTTRAGQVLGQRDKAGQLVGQVRQRIATVKAAHPEFAGRTFTIGPVISASQFYTTSSTTDASAKFYSQLGFTLSPKVTSLPPSSTPGRSQISAERLDVIDADVMILAFVSAEVRKQVEALPVFQRLTSVRRGSYIPLDLTTAIALAFPSVLSIPYGLDATVPKLATAVAAL